MLRALSCARIAARGKVDGGFAREIRKRYVYRRYVYPKRISSRVPYLKYIHFGGGFNTRTENPQNALKNTRSGDLVMASFSSRRRLRRESELNRNEIHFLNVFAFYNRMYTFLQHRFCLSNRGLPMCLYETSRARRTRERSTRYFRKRKRARAVRIPISTVEVNDQNPALGAPMTWNDAILPVSNNGRRALRDFGRAKIGKVVARINAVNSTCMMCVCEI